MPRAKPMVLDRRDIEQAAWQAIAKVDDETLPDAERREAYGLYFRLSDVLMHQEHGADGKRSIRMVPLGFKWAQFYTEMVEELLLDLGSEVVEANPARVRMARTAGTLTDNALYSLDFRLDCADVLAELVEGLKRNQSR